MYLKPYTLMRISTPLELSTAIRHARQQAGLTQAQLAERIGVRRLWVVRFENGKAEVELGTVMLALRELGLTLDIAPTSQYAAQRDAGTTTHARSVAIDLDAVLTGEHDE